MARVTGRSTGYEFAGLSAVGMRLVLTKTPSKRKGKIGAEGRKRIAAAQRRSWAAEKAKKS